MAFVLIVDDHADTCHAMAMLMRRLGRASRCVYRGGDALKLVTSDRPALVLLDISMPEMDGLETLRRIRATDAGRGVPVVMLTAMDDAESRRRASDLGANDYLLKAGFDLRRFKDVLAAYVPA